jgi:hypothetical protein
MIKKFAITGSAEIPINPVTGYSDISTNLQQMGLVETSIQNCDSLIFLNYNRKSYKEYIKLGKKIEKLVLIRLEPTAVFPSQYKSSVEKKFGLIIDPGRKSLKENGSDFVGWPYKFHLNPSTPKLNDPHLDYSIKNAIMNGFFDFDNWNKRNDKVVLVASNKVSPTQLSNYKVRRKIAKQMTRQEIDVYGDLWGSSLVLKISHRVSVGLNALKAGFFPRLSELYGNLFSRYSNYLGKPENKHLVIQGYKFCLVIENSSDYCSEKLFDSIINGSIPLYVGPRNTELFLPNHLYYQSSGSVEEIRKILSSVQEQDVNVMLNSMQKFLESEYFIENWSSEKVYEKIALKINSFWSNS